MISSTDTETSRWMFIKVVRDPTYFPRRGHVQTRLKSLYRVGNELWKLRFQPSSLVMCGCYATNDLKCLEKCLGYKQWKHIILHANSALERINRRGQTASALTPKSLPPTCRRTVRKPRPLFGSRLRSAFANTAYRVRLPLAPAHLVPGMCCAVGFVYQKKKKIVPTSAVSYLVTTWADRTRPNALRATRARNNNA